MFDHEVDAAMSEIADGGSTSNRLAESVGGRKRVAVPTPSIRPNDALAQPDREWLDIHLAFRHRECQVFELVIRSVELKAVQEGNKLRSRRSDSLVAVHKGMVQNKRMHERSRFRSDIRVKILTPEGHHGACNRGLQRALVPYATRPSECFDLSFVEVENLSK
jgi:hypothetical protein